MDTLTTFFILMYISQRLNNIITNNNDCTLKFYFVLFRVRKDSNMNWRRQTKFLSGEKLESNILEIAETDVEYSGTSRDRCGVLRY